MKCRIILFVLILPILSGCRQQTLSEKLQQATWIDLTHAFDSNAVYWPTNIPFSHDTVSFGMTEKGYFYSSFRFAAEEHGGTHFDAPVHFAGGGKFVHEIPVEQLYGPGVVIDVTGQAAADRDYLVSVKDLEAWERRHGTIPEGAIVLLNTGFAKFWTDKAAYTGTLKTGREALPELSFPGLDPEAAEWLVKNRSIKAVGIDTPSIDHGRSTEFLTHRILCAAGLTMYENLDNLGQLPPSGASIIALPMKIRGGSGAPLRIAGIVEK